MSLSLAQQFQGQGDKSLSLAVSELASGLTGRSYVTATEYFVVHVLLIVNVASGIRSEH